MLHPRWAARPLAFGRDRAFLRLEVLEGRDQPSWPDTSGFLTDPPDESAPLYQADENQAPQILNFTAEEVGNGLFIFTGRVVDENPAGSVVVFGSDGPTMQGQTAVVQSDGTFSLLIRLRTDGSDVGFVTATTADGQGAVSNEAAVFVTPTPPPS